MTVTPQREISLPVRLRLFAGVVRRLLLLLFRRGYVRRQLARRQGDCRRCGACCQMTWRCPFFQICDGEPSCKAYKLGRLPNCTTFPIDGRDLADRDQVAGTDRCGYFWVDEGR